MAEDCNNAGKVWKYRLRFLQVEVHLERRQYQQLSAGQTESTPLPQKSEPRSQKSKAIRALRKGRWMLYCGYWAQWGAFYMAGQLLFHSHIDWTDYVTVGILILIGILLRWAAARSSQEALEVLSRERDTQTIGHIINSFLGSYMADWQSEMMARNALLQLLPWVTREETSRLGILQRRFLYNRVKYGNLEQDGDLLIALLDTFKRLKDTRAIPAVQKLLRREVKTDKGRRVHEKAQHCLATLIEWSEQTQADTTLLRAADSPEPTAEELLHPATISQEEAPQQLLRPREEEGA